MLLGLFTSWLCGLRGQSRVSPTWVAGSSITLWASFLSFTADCVTFTWAHGTHFHVSLPGWVLEVMWLSFWSLHCHAQWLKCCSFSANTRTIRKLLNGGVREAHSLFTFRIDAGPFNHAQATHCLPIIIQPVKFHTILCFMVGSKKETVAFSSLGFLWRTFCRFTSLAVRAEDEALHLRFWFLSQTRWLKVWLIIVLPALRGASILLAANPAFYDCSFSCFGSFFSVHVIFHQVN